MSMETFQMKSLGQEKHLKHVFGVRVRWEFEKIWIKIKKILPRPTFIKKKRVLLYDQARILTMFADGCPLENSLYGLRRWKKRWHLHSNLHTLFFVGIFSLKSPRSRKNKHLQSYTYTFGLKLWLKLISRVHKNKFFLSGVTFKFAEIYWF